MYRISGSQVDPTVRARILQQAREQIEIQRIHDAALIVTSGEDASKYSSGRDAGYWAALAVLQDMISDCLEG